MNDQELKHYGVLGMRWGVRKRRVSTSSSRKVVQALELLREE